MGYNPTTLPYPKGWRTCSDISLQTKLQKNWVRCQFLRELEHTNFFRINIHPYQTIGYNENDRFKSLPYIDINTGIGFELIFCKTALLNLALDTTKSLF